jgi:hypothetical protein
VPLRIRPHRTCRTPQAAHITPAHPATFCPCDSRCGQACTAYRWIADPPLEGRPDTKPPAAHRRARDRYAVSTGAVAQLAEALGLGPSQCGFESHRPHEAADAAHRPPVDFAVARCVDRRGDPRGPPRYGGHVSTAPCTAFPDCSGPALCLLRTEHQIGMAYPCPSNHSSRDRRQQMAELTYGLAETQKQKAGTGHLRCSIFES